MCLIALMWKNDVCITDLTCCVSVSVESRVTPSVLILSLIGTVWPATETDVRPSDLSCTSRCLVANSDDSDLSGLMTKLLCAYHVRSAERHSCKLERT